MNGRIGVFAAVAIAAAVCAFPPAHAQNARGCNLPPQFPCPEPRIVSFEAKPDTITPGGSAELVWATENTGTARMTVSPTVGTVVARGTARVTPAATTTYTLSVGPTLTRTVTVTVEGTTPVAASAVMETPTETPRMPDGKPRLAGVYSTFGGRGRGAGPGGPRAGGPGAPDAQSGLALADRPTLKPGMEKYIVPAPDPNVVVSECGPNSVPPAIGPYNFQIVQSAETVIILYEYMHLFRVIPIDATHQPGPSSWMGDSVGRWEGDTLVIETNNFNTKSTVGGGGFGGGFLHSDALRMVERMRRPNYGSLEWETTLEDPNVFVAPWRTTSRYNFHPEFKRVEEYICTENLKDYDYLVDPTKDIK
jgi:hypothetical protein